MTDQHETHSSSTPRERELEVEVARLQAELDTLRGDDPSVTTSRFLAMAAATVDQAVADARREADEIVEEVSAQAEARRDEATRVAAEAEAMAEQKLAEADRAQEAIEEAAQAAAAIKSAAEVEAATFVSTERQKVAAEVEAFAQVRAALDDERVALETYHEKLRRGVQDLAESMVSFMSTEIAGGGAAAIEDLVSPQLEAALVDLEHSTEAPITDLGERTEDPADLEDRVDLEDSVDLEDPADLEDSVDLEDRADLEDGVDLEDGADLEDGDDDPLDTDPPVTEPAAEHVMPDPWVAMLETAIPEEDRIVDMPDTAIGEIPTGPSSYFGGAPVLEDPEPAASAGLFSRARGRDDTVLGFDDLAADDDDDFGAASDADADAEGGERERSGRTGLFGMLGARLVEQTPPDELAEALENDDADDTDDQAFRQFLDGDDAPDPSRDWLLRPEQS